MRFVSGSYRASTRTQSRACRPQALPSVGFGNVAGVIALSVVMLLTASFGGTGAKAGVVIQQSERPLPTTPDVSADTVFAIDIDADLPLLSKNADERTFPASTTKVATAMMALRVLETDQMITIVESDQVDMTVFSNMGLQAGDQVSVRDLLFGLMLPSGNDAARALARTAGSQLSGASENPIDTFMNAVNDLCRELGATNTNFTNPAGEHDDNHYSTARDMAILTAALLDVPLLADIVATQALEVSITGEQPRAVTIVNTNPLLGETGITGVKTGSTPEAGACLITGAAYGPRNRVVIVVLGSDLTYDESGSIVADSRFDDTIAMIRALNQEYQWVEAGDVGVVPGLAEELAAWRVQLAEPPALVVRGNQAGQITFQLRLGPAGNAGDEVGRVLFFANGDQIADYPVVQA